MGLQLRGKDMYGNAAPAQALGSRDPAEDATLRTISVERYVTPLREGGSLPAIVEADDDGLYVLKFRGAGQGPRALIAELIAGRDRARARACRCPEIVLAELDPTLARTEPDPEIQDLIRASAGLNLALDYLPGSVDVRPARRAAGRRTSRRAIVWFDAFVTNVDRTARNTNLLMLAPPPLADRPRRGALLPPRAGLGDRSGARARSVPADPRPRAAAAAPSARRRSTRELARRGSTPACSSAIVALDARRLAAAPTPASTTRPTGARPTSRYLRGALGPPRVVRRGGASVPADARCYDYAVVRVVPRVERERVRQRRASSSRARPQDFLEARIELDEARLLALDPAVDLEPSRAHLAAIPRDLRRRRRRPVRSARCRRASASTGFAPRSTIIQMSPVHTGRAARLDGLLDHLLGRLVRHVPGTPVGRSG